MADGEGCKCGAYAQWECGCKGVDWRSSREVYLEDRCKELIEALKKYGVHEIKCPNGEWNVNKKALIEFDETCTCGLKNIIEKDEKDYFQNPPKRGYIKKQA